jgi:hypothetical protein
VGLSVGAGVGAHVGGNVLGLDRMLVLGCSPYSVLEVWFLQKVQYK